MKMMKKISGIVAAFFLGTIAFAQSSSDSTLKNTAASRFLAIDPQQTSPFNDGIWEGWGTSLCWWANRLGYSQELTDQSAKLFFSDQGLDLNIVRYNIGGGDNPKHNHITRTDSMMEGFLVKKGKNQYEYNWDLDKNQRNVLSKIASISKPFHFEAFSNSAPYFMTKSGCTSGAVIGLFDNLKSKSYDDFAEYLATVAEHFKIHEGIEFQSISAMNEPTNIYWWAKSYKQEGCHFGFGKSQSKMTVALKKALDRHNLSQITITGTDETSVRSQTKAIKKLSKEALSYIKRIDTHTYMGDIYDKQELSKAVQKTGKGLWMSEVDGGSMLDKKFKDEMSCPLWLAKKIIEDIRTLRPSAWVMWQIIDNHICKDGYMGRMDSGMVDLNKGYWGCAVADHDSKNIILTQKYFVYGQFTRYIKPGMKILGTFQNDLIALDQEHGQIAAVCVNEKPEECKITLDLRKFSKSGAKTKAFRTRGTMKDGEHWQPVPSDEVQNGTFSAKLAPYSVTTFIIEGVQP